MLDPRIITSQQSHPAILPMPPPPPTSAVNYIQPGLRYPMTPDEWKMCNEASVRFSFQVHRKAIPADYQLGFTDSGAFAVSMGGQIVPLDPKNLYRNPEHDHEQAGPLTDSSTTGQFRVLMDAAKKRSGSSPLSGFPTFSNGVSTSQPPTDFTPPNDLLHLPTDTSQHAYSPPPPPPPRKPSTSHSNNVTSILQPQQFASTGDDGQGTHQEVLQDTGCIHHRQGRRPVPTTEGLDGVAYIPVFEPQPHKSRSAVAVAAPSSTTSPPRLDGSGYQEITTMSPPPPPPVPAPVPSATVSQNSTGNGGTNDICTTTTTAVRSTPPPVPRKRNQYTQTTHLQATGSLSSSADKKGSSGLPTPYDLWRADFGPLLPVTEAELPVGQDTLLRKRKKRHSLARQPLPLYDPFSSVSLLIVYRRRD